METIAAVASVTSALAGMVHGGILAAFALLMAFHGRIQHRALLDVVRMFRACGATLGVSLGLFILSEAARFPAWVNPQALPGGWPTLDAFALHLSPEHPMFWASVRVLVFGVYWVRYTRLEVWALEPCRKLDPGTHAPEGAALSAFEAAARVVRGQLIVNALLFAGVVGMGAALFGSAR